MKEFRRLSFFSVSTNVKFEQLVLNSALHAPHTEDARGLAEF